MKIQYRTECHTKKDDPDVQVCKKIETKSYYDPKTKSMVNEINYTRKRKDQKKNIQYPHKAT